MRKVKRFYIDLILICLFLAFLPGLGLAQVPQKMNYQGYLTDPGGTPIHGMVTMVFSIYEVAAGGTALWSETQSVVVNQGVYSINLGNITPVSLPFDKAYYLGVKVGSDPEMTPRIPLTSVGYAFTSNTAFNLVCSGCVSQSELSFTPGDITAVYPGTGMSGGGTSGDVTLNADTSYLQRRVSGVCAAGYSIRQINADGTVVCETDDVGGLTLPYSGTANSTSTAFAVTQDGTGWGINGESNGTFGVRGRSNAADGVGVAGYGYASGGTGVFGQGQTKGLWGFTNQTNAYSVYGESTIGVGVVGTHTGSTNSGELGHGNAGVRAFGYGNSRGVHAQAVNATALHGESTGGYGVYGISVSNDSVVGESSGSRKSGIYGVNSNYDGYGVYGRNTYQGTYGYLGGISGVSGYGFIGVAGDGYYGVDGTANTDYGAGVRGSALTTHGKGVEGYGNQYDFYASGPGINYGPFTGGHEVRLSESFPQDVKPGMIVSVTGETRIRKDKDGKISLSSTLPTVRLSTVPMEKNIFGAFVSEAPLPHDHWYQHKDGERFATVNALGEGRVWVSNINGNIEAGDYITTSSIPGYGQRQDNDVLHNYTLGKAIENVDWDSVTDAVEFNGKNYKIYLIAVVYKSG